MVDGVRVVVPDSLNLITPYVLMEQNDWFEDEIKFLRRLLQPGQKVIDIGANYGVYTLSMAQTVGATGEVWAFEPASSTAELLAKGIEANGFSHVVLEQSALSSASGTAQLSLNENSELNALVTDGLSTDESEAVPLVTIDECMDKYGWQDIAFMKIDAEGEEANILKGGKRFFGELSPLIEYEIKAGEDLHMELVQHFAEIGYDSYRLVPGLNLLVPFDPESLVDGYLLNLFCCKKDRAKKLADDGFLTPSFPKYPARGMEVFEDILTKARNSSEHHWEHTVAQLPYGAKLANLWKKTVTAGNSIEVEEAMACYALSRDTLFSATERFDALEASFSQLDILCRRQPSFLRLASLARVAQDYGARAIATDALNQLMDAIIQQNQIDPSEPFLAPCERFDSIPPGEAIGNWVLAAVMEQFERLGYFSSFYSGDSGLQRLNTIHALGFVSDEMERRLNLLQQRYGSNG